MFAFLACVLVPCPTAADAAIVLETLAGEEKRLPLATLELDDPRRFDAHIVRFEGLAEAPTGAGGATEQASITLVGGENLRARVVGGREETLALRIIGDAPLALPLDLFVSLRFEERLAAARSGALTGAEEGDRLYHLRVGGDGVDRLDGTVLDLGAEGVLFESVIGEKRYPWPEVGALYFESLDVGAADEDVAVPVDVDLSDGGRIAAGLVRIDASGVALRFAGGAALDLPPWAVRQLTVKDGRCAWLSAREPREVDDGSPFDDDLGMRWPARADRSVSGHPLTVGGRTFPRGLGVHAPSRLVYDLDGTWRGLRGQVGIDDEVLALPARGSVTFSILLDGESVWTSPIVRGGDRALPLPALDLAGKRELTLVVDEATDLFVADRADWLELLLVR